MVAVCHGAGLVAPGIGPLVIWLMHKDGKSDFVAYRAKQAAIVQGVIIAVMIVSCGLATFLAPLWWAGEAWLAWQAWQGKREGYPGMPVFPG